MAQITLQGNTIETIGELPKVNTQALPFTLAKTDFSDCSLKDFSGKNVILNIFPALRIPLFSVSQRTFLLPIKDFVKAMA